ncbi:hypothetical protein ACFZA9_11895 [Streptomyces olivaceus]|uniref:hypothetical protein n=1 Tax=Streptomyces olivaceus TaxID=47716 RepID=UPI0036F0AC48
MTENQSEAQLADQVRIDLLKAIGSAAQSHRGENALRLAEAYAILKVNAPTEVAGTPTVVRPASAPRR